AFFVLRVPILRDIVGKLVDGDVLPISGDVADACPSHYSVPNDGHDRGAGHDAGRQDRVLNQGVQETRLASLELPDTGNVEVSGCDSRCPRERVAGETLEVEFTGERGECAQLVIGGRCAGGRGRHGGPAAGGPSAGRGPAAGGSPDPQDPKRGGVPDPLGPRAPEAAPPNRTGPRGAA